MRSANEFAGRYEIEHRFDSWAEMAASDVIDAVYIATPTSVREEIPIAAANGGKHVLGEKPFASADSVGRIADGAGKTDARRGEIVDSRPTRANYTDRRDRDAMLA